MITIAMAYYDNPNMLARHLREWKSYPRGLRNALSVIIVDDASPSWPAANVVEKFGYFGIEIRVYRVLHDVPWNQDGARNLAMKKTTTEWVLLTDMDHLLPATQVEALLEFHPHPGSYYMPGQRTTADIDVGKRHPNTFLFRREDFWRMGGYDEDFAGWYGSDGNFRKCARGAGLHEIHTDAFHLVVYRTEDIFDANTKGLGRKDSKHHASRCPALQAKREGPPYIAELPIRFEYVRQM